MDLKLIVAKSDGGALHANESVIVDSKIFSIGRGADNSWTLPDPKLHISNKHCVIHAKNDEYHLTDISTNGVYVNGDDEPLGRGKTAVLKQADSLAIGDYLIRVELTGNSSLITENVAIETALNPDFNSNNIQPVALSTLTEPDDTQKDLDTLGNSQVGFDDLMNSEGVSSSAQTVEVSDLYEPVSPEKEYFRPPTYAPSQDDSDATVADHSLPNSTGIPDNWMDMPESNVPTNQNINTDSSTSSPILSSPTPQLRIHEAAPDKVADQLSVEETVYPTDPVASPNENCRKVEDHRPTAVDREQMALFDTLLAAAGVPAAMLSDERKTQLAEELGLLIKHFSQGIVDTLATRTMVKSEFRLQQTMIRPADNNPFKFSPTGSEALKIMLMGDSQAYLDANDAVIESFKDIQAHQLAMLSGIKAAFNQFLARFEPGKLAQDFDRHPNHSKGFLARQTTDYWKEYEDFYQDIAQKMEDQFQDLFSHEFGYAYEEQLGKLKR